MNTNEIVIYQPNNTITQFEVLVKDETVWLNRNQIANLFDRDVKTIGKHISNALDEELRSFSVVAKFATTATDGKKYQIAYYNLDMIISIGYRVKSARGIEFRIWANQILKDYLLKGYVIHQRVEKIEKKLLEHDQKFDLLINTTLPPHEGIFYDGQIFDAYAFVSSLVKSAQTSIILIDNYVDESVLMLLSKRNHNVTATIYTHTVSKQLQIDLYKFNAQYPPLSIKTFSKSHDRFLIIDNETIYHLGASLKDLGKKWFAFSKINIPVNDIIEKLDANALL